jgi:hypothetical protein
VYGSLQSAGMVSSDGNYRDHLLSRLARLRGLSAEQRREEYGAYMNELHRQHAAALRSVSEVYRARMIYEADIEANYRASLKGLLREIAGLEG